MKYAILDRDPGLAHFQSDLELRMRLLEQTRKRVCGSLSLSDFANGWLYYGFHPSENGWVYREWAPGADALALVGDFNHWDPAASPMHRINEQGDWEVEIPALPHLSYVKVWVTSGGISRLRIPLYMSYVVQDRDSGEFCGRVWDPPQPFVWTDSGFIPPQGQPRIYEAHIGMSDEEGRVADYDFFTERILPKIHAQGYDTLQLMAVMQHSYYASFGYQVTNYFAPSSWYGDPGGLRRLVDRAHALGIRVLLDVVHSHASANIEDGINEFDGTEYQFFHAGERGNHPAWGTKLFDYGKPEVLHFLLSNLKFWMTQFHFDGFRFDGVTSMLYHNHGLGESFVQYEQYFSMNTDTEAVTYLQLANQLVHMLNPQAVTIAEDMSGMPGMALPVEEGGIGFDYRLAMGIPDFWAKTVEKPEEEWDLGRMWYELTTHRSGEKTITYCECHDQALVGDKTLIFRMADQDMYWHMHENDSSPTVERAIELSKMIRLITLSLGNGYLNFMGNEFGHPEWIDFPREGNGWSHRFCRRQWSLAERPELQYHWLLDFDKAMIGLSKQEDFLLDHRRLLWLNQDQMSLAFERGALLVLVNFDPAFEHRLDLHSLRGNHYDFVLCTAEKRFGGWLDPQYGPLPQHYGPTNTPGEIGPEHDEHLLLPPRCAVVYRKTEEKKV